MTDITLIVDGVIYDCEKHVDPVEPELSRIVAYAQQDPRWRNHGMGGVAQTIGSYGCAMVCACMVYTQVYPAMRPDDFNRILTQHGGYNIIDRSEAHLAWDRLPDIFEGLSWQGRRDWTRALLDSEIAQVFALIDEAPLVLWTDSKPNVGGLQSHFILATGHTDDDIECVDPWEGVRSTLMERYGRGGSDTLKRAIWGYRRLVIK